MKLDDILALRLPRVEQSSPAGPIRRRADLDARCHLSLDEPTTLRALLNLLRGRTFPRHPSIRFEADGGVYEVQVSIVPVG